MNASSRWTDDEATQWKYTLDTDRALRYGFDETLSNMQLSCERCSLEQGSATVGKGNGYPGTKRMGYCKQFQLSRIMF